MPGTYEDAAPVPIRLRALAIDHTVLTRVTGKVYTAIGQEVKQRSPVTNTFQVLSSRLKEGSAERGIVSGLEDLIAQVDR